MFRMWHRLVASQHVLTRGGDRAASSNCWMRSMKLIHHLNFLRFLNVQLWWGRSSKGADVKLEHDFETFFHPNYQTEWDESKELFHPTQRSSVMLWEQRKLIKPAVVVGPERGQIPCVHNSCKHYLDVAAPSTPRIFFPLAGNLILPPQGATSMLLCSKCSVQIRFRSYQLSIKIAAKIPPSCDFKKYTYLYDSVALRDIWQIFVL